MQSLTAWELNMYSDQLGQLYSLVKVFCVCVKKDASALIRLRVEKLVCLMYRA